MLNLNPHSKLSLSSGIYLYRPYTSSNHRLESAGLNALIFGDPGATSRDDAIFLGESLCTSQIEASTSAPGQSPGHLNFWKIFVQIPPSRGRKAVQMPHYRSIPGDQMPPPLGNFSVAFIMLRKLCM